MISVPPELKRGRTYVGASVTFESLLILLHIFDADVLQYFSLVWRKYVMTALVNQVFLY